MASYQIKAIDTGNVLFNLHNMEFRKVLSMARDAARELDGPVAVMGAPIGSENRTEFTEELWRSDQQK